MSNNPQDTLNSFLHTYQLDSAYQRDDSMSMSSRETSASNHFNTSDRRSATIRIYRPSNMDRESEYLRAQFDKRMRRKSTGPSYIKDLELGELTYLYQDRYRQWEGQTIRGQWVGQVSFGFYHQKHHKQCKEATSHAIRLLYTHLGKSEETNKADQNRVISEPDTICTQKMIDLMRQPLNLIRHEDLDWLVETTRARENAKHLEEYHSPTQTSFIGNYKDLLFKAARMTRLTPELLGAVILSETRGLDNRFLTSMEMERIEKKVKEINMRKIVKRLPIRDEETLRKCLENLLFAQKHIFFILKAGYFFESYLRSQNTVFTEEDRDYIYSFFNDGVSVGLGQRQIDSLINMGVHEAFPELNGLENTELRKTLLRRLFLPEHSIFLIAWFVRKMADRLAGYNGPCEEQLAAFVSLFSCGELNLSDFSKHAEEWTAAHISLIGWKYNTGHIENIDKIEGIRGWGDMFLSCYTDIVLSNVLE